MRISLHIRIEKGRELMASRLFSYTKRVTSVKTDSSFIGLPEITPRLTKVKVKTKTKTRTKKGSDAE